MARSVVTMFLLGWLGSSPAASAQTRTGTSAGASVTWTAVGAGAGFGVGLWAGLTVFDDAIHSDRKVWTTALAGAAAGGVGAYLLTRALGRPAAQPAAPSSRVLPARCLNPEGPLGHLTIRGILGRPAMPTRVARASC